MRENGGVREAMGAARNVNSTTKGEEKERVGSREREGE